ncbi:MAG TPA: hypothetical protein VKT82_13570 [Ktedonobacterales bacterium]|nr:hypothetical protein [Ktedonobacterales bacterium]
MTNVVIEPEAWVGWGIVILLLSVFILVPLIIMIVQLPKLWRNRRYALFSLFSFIWLFSVFSILISVVPMFIAIKIPYP